MHSTCAITIRPITTIAAGWRPICWAGEAEKTKNSDYRQEKGKHENIWVKCLSMSFGQTHDTIWKRSVTTCLLLEDSNSLQHEDGIFRITSLYSFRRFDTDYEYDREKRQTDRQTDRRIRVKYPPRWDETIACPWAPQFRSRNDENGKTVFPVTNPVAALADFKLEPRFLLAFSSYYSSVSLNFRATNRWTKRTGGQL